ncbi:MAG: tRNA (adenosine(37)-N6)-dimethylallyltransferase MiaA [Bacteroidetes bacterium HGW-Bacteroidetes-21]|jgi:tRNA dimethylallyltransferase|nr:MAG: tRNA (adenosine(37)-N6)-dimethylallyltransferase MiaA [Bacteroidetes bacterium HGW-Bacteroidetes-21]
MKPLLVVVAGPTAVGKTALSVQLAENLHCPIISADSRQFYKELKIGTAPPSEEELSRVKHYFIGHLSISDYYNVSQYEQNVQKLFSDNIIDSPVIILTGGSGLYINAVCHGIAEMPDMDPALRKQLMLDTEKGGLDFLRCKLEKMDPVAFSKIDKNNKNRLLRAVEMNLMTGKNLAEIHSQSASNRPFRVLKLALNLPRDILYSRINQRVDHMMAAGFEEEARCLLPFRHLNALNTVGYKELFHYLEGLDTLDGAIEKIKTSTRKYAKRQLTWFRADDEYQWFEPSQMDEMMSLISSQI